MINFCYALLELLRIVKVSQRQQHEKRSPLSSQVSSHQKLEPKELRNWIIFLTFTLHIIGLCWPGNFRWFHWRDNTSDICRNTFGKDTIISTLKYFLGTCKGKNQDSWFTSHVWGVLCLLSKTRDGFRTTTKKPFFCLWLTLDIKNSNTTHLKGH